MKMAVYIVLLSAFTLLGGVEAYAQKHKERAFIRAGNELYENGEYVESEVSYRRAIEISPGSIEAKYNLAAALYKQEQFKEAAKMYESIMSDSVVVKGVSPQVLYNRGNALFKQRELESALESYKSSLRLNPNDMEAKFNLAYTQKLLKRDKEEEEKKKDQEKDDKEDKKDDQDKEDKKDGQDEKDKNQDKDNQKKDDPKDGDDNDGDKEEDKQKDQQNPENGGGEKSQNAGKITKQDAEQMLNAVQMEEDKTRDKQGDKEVKSVGRSGKNW